MLLEDIEAHTRLNQRHHARAHLRVCKGFDKGLGFRDEGLVQLLERTSEFVRV